MIDNHGTTTINFYGKVSIVGLTVSNFKSQEEAVLMHLGWADTAPLIPVF
jgi:hypothetical protein